MLLLAALAAAALPTDDDQRLARMVALYDQACVKTFPDDKAVEALMVARGAKELSPEAVKVTMRDDPARGWNLGDGGRPSGSNCHRITPAPCAGMPASRRI